jgi:hypothetical protein
VAEAEERITTLFSVPDGSTFNHLSLPAGIRGRLGSQGARVLAAMCWRIHRLLPESRLRIQEREIFEIHKIFVAERTIRIIS